jgi:hypothetical protein
MDGPIQGGQDQISRPSYEDLTAPGIMKLKETVDIPHGMRSGAAVSGDVAEIEMGNELGLMAGSEGSVSEPMSETELDLFSRCSAGMDDE